MSVCFFVDEIPVNSGLVDCNKCLVVTVFHHETQRFNNDVFSQLLS